MTKKHGHRMLKAMVGRRPKSKADDAGTRASILAAARCVFARRGYDGTSVREVAEKARVNQAMIYYYFKDKTDLYRSVLSDSFESMLKIWNDDIFKGGAPVRKKIQKYIEGFIRYHHRNEDLRRILAMEFSRSGTKGERMRWIAERYFSRNHAALTDILKQGMKSGELKKLDPLLVVVSLFGMIIHSFIFMPIVPYIQGKKANISVSKLGSFVNEIFFNGLCSPVVQNHAERRRQAFS